MKRGFTLLEVIVAVFIFTTIVAGVAAFAVFFLQSYTFSFEENQSVAQSQQAMTRMIREIREARVGDDGAWPLSITQDNALTFYSDVTNDGRTDKVRYFVENNQLKKGVIEPTQVPVAYNDADEQISVISDNLDTSGGSLFTYYNGDWPADVVNNPLVGSERLLNTRYIEINITINIETNTGSQPFSLSSGVHIRSLKNNL